MAILLHNGFIKVIRLSVDLKDFTRLLATHNDPRTPKVEAIGVDYVASGFASTKTVNFVKEVCNWGNYPGIWGKVLLHNTIPEITAHLRDAHAAIIAANPALAIEKVTKIKGLGVSFGSKHLKFLDPDNAVVLDSIISERLGYQRTPGGYVEFLADCFALRDILNNQKIMASVQRPIWRVSDVEMALYKAL